MRRLLCVAAAVIALAAGAALTATAAPRLTQQPRPAAISPTDWLGEVNLYRAAAGLSPVADEPTWDLGLQHHFTYLEKTDPSLMTGQYASAHTENPASPYYTPDGAKEGGASDLIENYPGQTPVQYIDGWFRSPFHAIGMLRPNLTKVAFASDAAGDAAIDVISGLDYNQPAATTPTLFPGPGMTTYLTHYGAEYPDPLETCGWPSNTPAGLPMIAMLPAAPAQGLTASVTGPDGTMATGNGQLCAVDENTYHSSDPIYGPTGLQILQGDHAVLLIPRTPLTWGRSRRPSRSPARRTSRGRSSPPSPDRSRAGTRTNCTSVTAGPRPCSGT